MKIEVEYLGHATCDLDEEDVRVADALYGLPDFEGKAMAQRRVAAMQVVLSISSAWLCKSFSDSYGSPWL